jgi:phosphoglycerate dehydrogenase-like enzyme
MGPTDTGWSLPEMLLEAVLVGPQDFFFDPAEAAVTAKGHTVRRYRSSADFLRADNALAHADVLYAVGYLDVSRALLAAAPRLRAVISPWMGTDGFDERAATDLCILVGNGQASENAESMAEATVMMILACLYDLNGTQRRFQEGLSVPPDLQARMLKGKTVGLIGYGGIARGVAQRLSTWGVTFLAYTPRPPADSAMTFVGLAQLLAGSDIVCVLAPLTPETRNMLNAERLASMKKGAILINTSRGGIVDEDALYALVKDGHLANVGLDVFQTEPLPMESPLRTLPGAVLTPHYVGHTHESRSTLIGMGVANVLRVLDGRPPLYLRNPDVLAAWRARWGFAAGTDHA